MEQDNVTPHRQQLLDWARDRIGAALPNLGDMTPEEVQAAIALELENYEGFVSQAQVDTAISTAIGALELGLPQAEIETLIATALAGVGAGGWKGIYDDAVDYPAGSIVEFENVLYGTTVDIPSGSNEPDVVTGANWGSPLRGMQPTTFDKLDDGVPHVFDFSDPQTDSTNGRPGIPFIIDFPTGSLTNLSLLVENDTDRNLAFYLEYATGGNGTLLNNVGAGQTVALPVNVATFFGGNGDYVLAMVSTDVDVPVGEVTLTVTGAVLNPPEVPNPWVGILSMVELDAAIAGLEPGPWIEIPSGDYFGEAAVWDWEPITGAEPSYRLLPGGLVEWRGRFRFTAGGAHGGDYHLVFTFPAEVAPTETQVRIVASFASGGGGGSGHGVFEPGLVQIVDNTSFGGVLSDEGADGSSSLDGIIYSID